MGRIDRKGVGLTKSSRIAARGAESGANNDCGFRCPWYARFMDSQPTHTAQTPFDRMRALATRVLSVSKAEVDQREREWQREREEKKRRKRAGESQITQP